MKLDQFVKTAKTAYEMNSVNKDSWRQNMFEKRWKYFFAIWIYIAVCIFFIWLGFALKDKIFIFNWYVLEILSFAFLALGVVTMFSYLMMIIRGKK